MNIVNFSDGVDGLAAGVCAIDGAAFAVIAFKRAGRSQRRGSACGHDRRGVAWLPVPQLLPRRRSSWATPGSNLLGYLLGVAAVIGSLKTNAVVALAVPLLVLAVPFLDTGFVVAKRLKYRQAPWRADAEHFHHRMARIGFSQRKTVTYLYALDADARRRGARAAVSSRTRTTTHSATTTLAGAS